MMKHYFFLLISVILISISCSNENIVNKTGKEPQIILQYNFSNNLSDASGNNFHGIKDTAIDYVPDRFSRMNEAIRFNGPLHDSYFEIPVLGNKQIIDTFSISFWFTITTATTNLFYKSDLNEGAESGHTVLTANGGKLRIILGSGNSGETKEYDANTALAANTWHHFVLSVNSLNDVKIYLNGQLYNNQMVASGSAINVGFNSSAAQVKGLLGGKSTFVPCDGKLDDFRLYNYAITAAEVESLYNYHP